METSVHLIFKFVPKEDQVALFLDTFNQLAVESRKEEGCIYYSLSQNIANEKEYYLVEEWKSKAALEAHEKTPHFVKLVPIFIRSIQDITKVEAHTA